MELGGLRVLAIVSGDDIRWRPQPSDPLVVGSELVVIATKRGLAMALRRGRTPAERPAPARAAS
jgi:hypothetical protein